MKIKVKCVCCGIEGDVKISRILKRIKSDWGYFGKPVDFIDQEYWECPRCLKNEG